MKKRAALAAEFFGNIDRHQPQSEHFRDQFLTKNTGLVHGPNVRREPFFREQTDRILEHPFFFGQDGQRFRHAVIIG